MFLHGGREATGVGASGVWGTATAMTHPGSSPRSSQFTNTHSLLIYSFKFDSLKCLTPAAYQTRFLCIGTGFLSLQNKMFIKCCNSCDKIVAQK